jgi:hypothetical protein
MGAPGGHGMRPNVWTPAGGWFPDPKGWKGNLGKAYLLGGVIGATIFYTSAQLEVRAAHASWSSSPCHRRGFNPGCERGRGSGQTLGPHIHAVLEIALCTREGSPPPRAAFAAPNAFRVFPLYRHGA